jgi:hypothetical protein
MYENQHVSMKNHHPTPSKVPSANQTQFVRAVAAFHPLYFDRITGVQPKRSVADPFSTQTPGFLRYKHKSAKEQAVGEEAVRTISPLKCRRLPSIVEGGTVPGDRRRPEGIPGGRLIKGPPHGRDVV